MREPCPHPQPALVSVGSALWCCDCGSLWERRFDGWQAPGDRASAKRQWNRIATALRKPESTRRVRRKRKAVGV